MRGMMTCLGDPMSSCDMFHTKRREDDDDDDASPFFSSGTAGGNILPMPEKDG